MTKRSVIIFSGYNTRAIIAFIRTLEKYQVQYAIIASAYSDSIFHTKYVDKVLSVRKKVHLNLDDVLHSIAVVQTNLESEDYLIAPSSEALNRFILGNLRSFQERKCILPLVNESLYQKISDKYSFGQLCKAGDINVPREYKTFSQANCPFVAKPRHYLSKNGQTYSPQIIKIESEKTQFKSDYDIEEFYFQEYVEGRSIYLLFYIDKFKRTMRFSQENHIQQPEGKSIIYARASNFHKHPVATTIEKLFLNIGFRGLVMVELRLNRDSFFMIEANPRFWGPSQLFVDAGVNFFKYLLEDYDVLGAEPDEMYGQLKMQYFWDDGISKTIGSTNSYNFFNYTEKKLIQELRQLSSIEMFNREDTSSLYIDKSLKKIEKLNQLYAVTSKHSNYQVLASELQKFISSDVVETKSRHEYERLSYIVDNIDFQNKTVLDVGGNTGFFTFELLKHGVRHIDYCEGNTEHSEFVSLASELLGYQEKINIRNEYLDFDNFEQLGHHDVIFLLNVLHHLGDDFGNKAFSKQEALEKMMFYIKKLAKTTEYLVLQLGFNWMGNVSLPLFSRGTKKEMVDWIKTNLKEQFDLQNVGIAQKNGDVVYRDLTLGNINRDDSLGEFLNRPIFILKSNQS